jgi:uncharacterized protein YpmS
MVCHTTRAIWARGFLVLLGILFTLLIIIIILIIHLLGLAPAGYLAAPDNGPEGRYARGVQTTAQTVVTLCH